MGTSEIRGLEPCRSTGSHSRAAHQKRPEGEGARSRVVSRLASLTTRYGELALQLADAETESVKA